MASKAEIMAAIQSKCLTYSYWRIGLTHDVAERKAYWRDTEKQSVTYWADWAANSISDANDIEAHFISKGMKGGTGGNLSPYKPVYVYVF
jgi:hypothetical protein